MVSIIRRRKDRADEKRMELEEKVRYGGVETIRLLMFSWLKNVKRNWHCVSHLLLYKDG